MPLSEYLVKEVVKHYVAKLAKILFFTVPKGMISPNTLK
jgi:hypothetical protein